MEQLSDFIELPWYQVELTKLECPVVPHSALKLQSGRYCMTQAVKCVGRIFIKCPYGIHIVIRWYKIAS
jgi:hypothetical protein